MEVICGLSMPVHSLLSRNDLQLICSQGQEPKGNFSPSLHRFLIDYNKLITNSNLVKQLVLPVERIPNTLRDNGFFFPIIICS